MMEPVPEAERQEDAAVPPPTVEASPGEAPAISTGDEDTSPASFPPELEDSNALGTPTSETSAPTGGIGWPELVERCKPRIPPFLRPFLDHCTGVWEGNVLTVYGDALMLGRFQHNDRVIGVLAEEAGEGTRILFREGSPPVQSPEENLRQLAASCRQYDSITVKGEI